jgi:hypothetical protein
MAPGRKQSKKYRRFRLDRSTSLQLNERRLLTALLSNKLPPRLVIIPFTDNSKWLSWRPVGPGKTESVKDLSKALTKQVVVFNQWRTSWSASSFKGFQVLGLGHVSTSLTEFTSRFCQWFPLAADLPKKRG